MIAADGQPASGGAGLGLGPMSFFDAQSRRIKGPGASKAFVVSRRVRLRLERRSGAPGSVRLSASLARDCAPLKLTLDGVVLRTEPAVIAPHVSLNSATAHTVELEIPASAPAGPVDAEIIWQVEDN
jgi:hypothetical protein